MTLDIGMLDNFFPLDTKLQYYRLNASQCAILNDIM